jgi:hypothetical protein
MIKLERIWKKAVVALFKVLFQHLPGGTEDNLSQDIRSPGRNFKPRSPEYEAVVLTTEPRCSVVLFT